MKRFLNRPGALRAFTLVELLVVIALLGTVGIALSGMIQFFYRGNLYLLEQTTALDSARRGVRDAVVSIREASYGDNGSYPIANAATSTLTVYSDFDDDNSIEQVRYVLNGNTLYRAVTNSAGLPPNYSGQPSSTSTIATYVQNGATPIFTYYDVDGVVLSATSTDTTRVAAVRITLTVDLNPLRAPNLFTLEETTTLRNVRGAVE